MNKLTPRQQGTNNPGNTVHGPWKAEIRKFPPQLNHTNGVIRIRPSFASHHWCETDAGIYCFTDGCDTNPALNCITALAWYKFDLQLHHTTAVIQMRALILSQTSVIQNQALKWITSPAWYKPGHQFHRTIGVTQIQACMSSRTGVIQIGPSIVSHHSCDTNRNNHPK